MVLANTLNAPAARVPSWLSAAEARLAQAVEISNFAAVAWQHLAK
jgi:hypothetical protein